MAHCEIQNKWTENDSREDMDHFLMGKSSFLCQAVHELSDDWFYGGGSYLIQESEDKLGIIVDLYDGEELENTYTLFYEEYEI